MDFWHSLSGMLTVKILSADSSRLLQQLHQANLEVHKVQFLDELQLQLQIHRKDYKRIVEIAEKIGGQVSILSQEGIYYRLAAPLHRPVFVLAVLTMFLLTIFVPTRIYFFRVEGNVSVPTNWILSKAEACGISFGVSRRDIRSEKVKNAVLQAIPELEWVGINTAGCVATISVRERQPDTMKIQGKGVSSIVARKDGVVTEISVTAGSPSVKPGDAIKAGQVLISGYTDCGLSIRATRAEGEVYAQTNHKLTLVAPLNSAQRGQITAKTQNFAVIIGKNRINFYQGSGILDASCVKMYSENYLTLPGGFQLPIAFVTETWLCYDEAVSTESTIPDLSGAAQKYLRGQMVAGKILSKVETTTQNDGVVRLYGEYACHEMIGQERNEEIITP